MSDIKRFRQLHGELRLCRLATDPCGDWVRYDDHRAEVERLTARQTEMETHITGLTTELHRTRADGIELRWVADEVEQLTAQRDAAQVEVERVKNAIDHLTSERDEAQAEVKRLIAERDEIHAEVQRLTQTLNGRRATADRVTAERDAAQAEVERLTEQVAALTVAVEQADEMKAHAEAAAAAEETETDRVMAERDAAQAEVERLKNAIDHLTSERDEAQAERDAAQRERERVQDLLTLAGRELSTLREALRVRRRDQSAQKLDMANGQAILDGSRPTDEDIWREVFFRCVSEYITGEKRVIIADTMLAEYRKRWPR